MSHNYKCCLVPFCNNNSTVTPFKRFIPVPQSVKQYQEWCKAMNFNNSTNLQVTNKFCCEDHFDLEADAENWLEIKFFQCEKVVLKPNVIPHIFKCQDIMKFIGNDKEKYKEFLKTMSNKKNQLQSCISKTVKEPKQKICPSVENNSKTKTSVLELSYSILTESVDGTTIVIHPVTNPVEIPVVSEYNEKSQVNEEQSPSINSSTNENQLQPKKSQKNSKMTK